MSDAFTFNEDNAPETEQETLDPSPRRRGRPPGSKNKPREGSEQSTSPESATPPKRRKRKPKPEDISFMAERLIGLHAMLAGFTGVPEFQLSAIEAKMLAESGLQVQREFDIEVGGKWAVLATFVGVCGIVYVPRFKMAADRARQRKREAGVVINGVATENMRAAA